MQTQQISAQISDGKTVYVGNPDAIQAGAFTRGFWTPDRAAAHTFTAEAAAACFALIQSIKTVQTLRIDDAPIQTPNAPCDPIQLSAWEQELWTRYGRVFYPQSAEGYRVFAQQRRTA